MKYIFIILSFLLIFTFHIYADTSGTLLGPINGPISRPGTGFGGVSCEGNIDSDQSQVSSGIVVVDKTSTNKLIVTITLEKGDAFTNYSIEIFESAPNCGLDDNANTGIILTTGPSGNGQAVVTLQLPYSPPEHTTIGDGIGTESIVVVLDMGKSAVSSSFNGNRFATRPIPISPKIIDPQISVSPSEGAQLSTTFKITGTGFTPLSTITRRFEGSDGKVVIIADGSNVSSDSSGNVTSKFTPTCDTKIGTSTIWLIDDKSGRISNTAKLKIASNQNCLGTFEAEFSTGTSTGTVPLKVKFTDKSKPDIIKGAPVGWTWNFGDGETSSEQNPEHTYRTAGAYTVGLMASNALVSDWEIKTNLINAKPIGTPTARFEASHFIGIAPMKVQFTDMSDNNPDTCKWDFGNGETSLLQDPAHTYKLPGFYTITFTASNSTGSDTIEKVNLINVKGEGEPIAKFSSEPQTGFNPLTCNFRDLSSGNIGALRWDFGDGETSSLQNPSHTYKKPGIFTAKLSVDGPNGTDEEAKTIDVLDGAGSGSSLMAAFVGSPRLGVPGTEVVFTDLSSGKVAGWLWDFGDNGISTAQNPKHIYTENSVYSVSLTVFNNDGKAYTETRLAYIEITDQDLTNGTETPTPVPTITVTPTPVPSPILTAVITPMPMPTVVVTPNPAITPLESPSESKIRRLTVEPSTAKSSVGFQKAVVTATDEKGNPVSGIAVNVFTSGLNSMVTPTMAVTGDNGTAIFKFKISNFKNNSKILFEAEGITATIGQE